MTATATPGIDGLSGEGADPWARRSRQRGGWPERYAWRDLVFMVRSHRLRTVFVRSQRDQVPRDAAWDGIPVRGPRPARWGDRVGGA